MSSLAIISLIVVGIAIVVGVVLLDHFSPANIPSVIPEKGHPIVVVTNVHDEVVLNIGTQFQIDYSFVDSVTGEPSLFVLHSWYAEKDPNIPGPVDFPVIFVDNNGRITPMNEGTRKVYLSLASDPGVRAFEFTVTVR